MTEYAPSNVRDWIVIATVFVLAFAAGWRCCLAWHSRRGAAPTPMQRALLDGKMRDYRADTSNFYGHIFLAGMRVSQRSQLN